MLRHFAATFFVVINFSINASISIVFKSTEQGYWYGKAYNNDPLIPSDICYEVWEDLCSIMSPAETLCFLSGILRKDHYALNKLKLWSYIKNNKLQIPQEDILSLSLDNLTIKTHLEASKWLLEKIKKFWGVDKNVHIYCFYSRMREKQQHWSGACLDNFVYGNDVFSVFLMCNPPLALKKVSLNEHLCVIAHEFSHAMCDMAYGSREKFEAIISKIQSLNAVVASWYLDEALATILGNGLFQEAVSKKKIDLKKEEYCARGFAPALYELTKYYFDKSKTIDKSFIENAVEIFDKVHPSGYIDPNICLRYVYVISPDDMDWQDIRSKLSKKTFISSYAGTSFSSITNNLIEHMKNLNHTIMVFFRDKKQLEPLRDILPKFDDKKPISIVHKNNRTYVLMKIDNKHSLEDRINELFSRKHS